MNSEKVNSAKFPEVCPFCKVGAVKNSEYLCGTTIYPLPPKQSNACENRILKRQLAEVTAERDRLKEACQLAADLQSSMAEDIGLSESDMHLLIVSVSSAARHAIKGDD